MKKLLRELARGFGVVSAVPFMFRKEKIRPPKSVAHSQWVGNLAKQFNKDGMQILEIGSRNVTGTNLRAKFSRASYVGFDFYAGENVDVVGDAHRLSSYFDTGRKFDLIFSSAVFEHLYMPWVVALEIHKLLKIGGHVFVETHFSYSSHERPWHFFQFSDMGLRALFNDSLGFELIDSGMCNPISGYFGHRADRWLRYTPVAELYCHSAIFCKKRCEVGDFDWSSVAIDEIVDGARYPKPDEPAV